MISAPRSLRFVNLPAGLKDERCQERRGESRRECYSASDDFVKIRNELIMLICAFFEW